MKLIQKMKLKVNFHALGATNGNMFLEFFISCYLCMKWG